MSQEVVSSFSEWEADLDWQSRAACGNADLDLFFPPEERESKRERGLRIAAARKVCGECTVQAVCLSWALENNEDTGSGVFGGTTREERNAMLNRLRRRR